MVSLIYSKNDGNSAFLFEDIYSASSSSEEASSSISSTFGTCFAGGNIYKVFFDNCLEIFLLIRLNTVVSGIQ